MSEMAGQGLATSCALGTLKQKLCVLRTENDSYKDQLDDCQRLNLEKDNRIHEVGCDRLFFSPDVSRSSRFG